MDIYSYSESMIRRQRDRLISTLEMNAPRSTVNSYLEEKVPNHSVTFIEYIYRAVNPMYKTFKILTKVKWRPATHELPRYEDRDNIEAIDMMLREAALIIKEIKVPPESVVIDPLTGERNILSEILEYHTLNVISAAAQLIPLYHILLREIF